MKVSYSVPELVLGKADHLNLRSQKSQKVNSSNYCNAVLLTARSGIRFNTASNNEPFLQDEQNVTIQTVNAVFQLKTTAG